METRTFLIIVLCLSILNSSAQETVSTKIQRISEFDRAIYEKKRIDVKTLGKKVISSILNTDTAYRVSKDTLVLRLYTLLELENQAISPDTLLFYLEKIRTYETIYELHRKLSLFIELAEESWSEYQTALSDIYIGGLKRNQKIVEDHMEHILEFNFCQYKNNNTSKQAIKGVYFQNDNDLLAFTNYDMNYTGGSRLEITTDYLKMQLLPFINKEKILSYQGIFFGFKAYTPFIRDTSIFNTNTSFDVDDRPFASFSFIGRSKYRLHCCGFFRMRSDLKIGIIGGNVGNIVQSVIHRDQFVSSVKPYGWDSQIAKGGRFAWNIDHYLEMMLFSGKGDIFNHHRRKPSWLNIPVLFEGHIGNELTALGAGIGFSNLNFMERSGNEDIKLKKSKKIRFLIMANANYRYVIHNSMLEGIGVFETFPDDDDPLAPKDIYRLEAEEVVRHLFHAELFVGFRVMKATVYWKLTVNSREYNKPKAKDMYQWGRIGVNFLL